LGASVLERLLEGVGVGPLEPPPVCGQGHLPAAMRSTGVRPKTLQTILGPVRFARSRYVCDHCGAVRYPGDQTLGVEATGFSPGLRRLMTRAGSRESFAQATADLHDYAGVRVDPKDVERVAEAVGRLIDDWMQRQGSAAVLSQALDDPAEAATIPLMYIALDATGVPIRKNELAGVAGKGEDGQARTRDVKLGCVFTQTTLDKEGRPVRDEDSTTYVGAIEPSVDFGHRLHAEAVRRGLARAQHVVVLGDGAPYNHAIALEYFPGATFVLDLYHARERLSDFIKDHTAQPSQGPLYQVCLGLLDQGRIEELTQRMEAALSPDEPQHRQGLTRIAYFVERAEQMRYEAFRRQGFFVGSGVIEAGCKTVIGDRLKRSGMHWTVRGANAIIAACCCLYSDRFEQFWEDAGS
jgi:hypothetical protein